MSTTAVKQNRIFNTLIGLVTLPRVKIRRMDDKNVFNIEHELVFVPNFQFRWCIVKEHYRVYIYVAGTTHDKKCGGYSICTVGSGLAAAGFCMLYAFMHKHRANSKESAFA